jgi:hypothetical protein
MEHTLRRYSVVLFISELPRLTVVRLTVVSLLAHGATNDHTLSRQALYGKVAKFCVFVTGCSDFLVLG